MSDEQLVAACLEGDRAAWNELVDRYERLVYGIPARYGMSEEDRQDVFQEVFAALLRQLAGLRDRQSLAKWLITTTHRQCWKQLRAAGESPTLAEGLALKEVAPPPELAHDWEQQLILRRALAELDGRCRHLLQALYTDASRRSYETIAQQLDMPVGSIGPTRARCLAKLLRLARARGLDVGR